MSETLKKPQFIIYSGAWQTSWHAKGTVEILREKGYDCYAAEIEVSDSRDTLRDHAKQLKANIKNIGMDPSRTIPVSQSRAVNPTVLSTEYLAILGIIFVNGSFQKEILGIDEFPDDIPPKHSQSFLEARQDCGDRRTFITEADAIKFLYQDCNKKQNRHDKSLAQQAAEKLVSQRDVSFGRKPKGLPNIPMASIISTNDEAIVPAHQLAVASRYLGGNYLQIPGGHCPQTSQPDRLASAVIVAANEFIVPYAG